MSFFKNLILVGVIKSSHGIKGHVVIKSFTDPLINITKKKLVNELEEDVSIKLLKQNNKGELICQFNNINRREEADNLKGYKLFCLRSSLPEPDENEFYIEDLKDLKVVDQDLNKIGKIKNILNFGAGDIIEIELLNKKTELLPFNKDFFPIITKDYIVLNYDLSNIS